MKTTEDVGSRDDGAESARAFLRRETQPLHQAVEDAFARFELTTREGLIGFLAAQRLAVTTIEEALDSAAIGTVLRDWPERRRSEALAADLALLGAGPSPPVERRIAPPTLDTIGQRFGALYVLEGSRLGGRVLARQVARSPDPEVSAATKYLLHKVEGPEPWGTFVKAMDELDAPREDLLQGAKASFSVFRRAALLQT